MSYLKSTVAGIAGATAMGLAVFAYRVYQSFHSPGRDVQVTDFYFPRWMPPWAVDKGIDFWFWARSNAPLLLIIAAFVIGFWWEYYRRSLRVGIPRH